MQQSSLLMHVVMIVVAVAIGYLYIYPTVQTIRKNQDTVLLFKSELERVSKVNQDLATKLQSINNIPTEDRTKLVSYMPDSLDSISIMRTLEAILIASGVTITSLEFGETSSQSGSSNDNNGQVNSLTQVASIATSFEADEIALTNFFQTIETSAYPFVLQQLAVTPGEDGRLSVDVTYAVHALVAEEASNLGSEESILIE